MVSLTLLNERYFYNPITGILIYKKDINYNALKGQRVGHFDKDGYRVVKINSKIYRVGRLIWFIMTGAFPVNEVDHIDRNPANDKFNNLRDANRSEQIINSKSRTNKNGFKGVKFSRGRFRAVLVRNNKQSISPKSYETPYEAHLKFLEMEKVCKPKKS